MENTITFLQEIEREAHYVKQDFSAATNALICQEINNIFSEIRKYQQVQEAQACFDALEQLQEILAALSFKYDIKMSSNLNKFIRDFDRIDDSCTRKFYFKEIKQNMYSL